MRFLNLLKNELLFTIKYGVLLLYVILTLLYTLFLSSLPESAKSLVGAILIFTDPAAMGLFFMGAIMLLEKSQRVNHALSVSPIKISEYILAKALSLLILGTIVGLIIGFFANANLWGVFLSVVLSSLLFSLCAIVVSVKTESLNSFMLGTVPFEIVICLPAFFYLLGLLKSDLWLIHPGISAIILLTENQTLWIYCIGSLVFWNLLAFGICHKLVSVSMQHLGGGKL